MFTCVRQSADHSDDSVSSLSSDLSRRYRKPLLTSVSFALLNAQSVNNKSMLISSAIAEEEYDDFLITETWHSTSGDVTLRRCTPPGYSCIDAARPAVTSGSTCNYGGVAAIITDRLSTRVIPLPVTVTTFESVCFSLHGAGSTVVVLLIYRPGSQYT